jgi:hypothetical protein
MIHAWTALFAAALTVAACWSAGVLLLSRCGVKLARVESIPLEFLTGACVFHLAIFAILAARIAYKPVLLAVCAAVIGAAIRKYRRPPGRFFEKHWTLVFLFAIFAVFSGVVFLNGWAPETSADGSGYHLEVVAHYLRARGFQGLQTNMYAALGQGIELLYVPAVAFGGFSSAALVHFAFWIALAWLIFAYGLRLGKPWMGAAAALLVSLSPVAARDGSTAYIDVAAAAIVFAVFYWLEIWDGSRDRRLLMAAGLLAGYAYAAKYTAAVILLYALAFVAVRARCLRPALTVAAFAALVIAPWMLKNWIFFRNPVAPFANEIFPNPYVHPAVEQRWAEWLRRYDLPKLESLPIQVTVRGDYTQGIVGPVFLAAPLALLTLRRPVGRRLLIAGLLLLAVYFGNIGTRFLIPALPFFALGMALAIENRWLLTGFAAAHAVLSWPSIIPRYANPYVWRIDDIPWKAALRITPESDYLRQKIGDWAALAMINDRTPPGEPVFFAGGIGSVAYSKREIIDRFRGAYGNTLWDILNTGWIGDSDPARLLVFRFPQCSVSRIRLLQTGRAEKYQQWSVHELRFFNNGDEIPRRREWRLRAWPDPFEVQLAFDNSQATRWRTWQTVAPGMYVDVDFGRAERIDEVRMETSLDSPSSLQFRVEKFEQGRWITLTAVYRERRNRVRSSLRRAATYELYRRGVHYIAVGDQDLGATAYNEHPEEWGLQQAGRVPGMTLYKILP